MGISPCVSIPLQMVFEDGDKPNRTFPVIKEETYGLKDILLSNFIPTCSVMFRNSIFGEFPDWYRSFKFMEDWALYVLIAQHGKISFLNEAMGVYRFHSMSTWSSQEEITRCDEEIKFYHCMEKHLNDEYKNIIRMMLDKSYYKMALLYEDKNEHENAKKYINKSIFVNPLNSQIEYISKIKTIFRLYFPLLYRFIKAHSF